MKFKIFVFVLFTLFIMEPAMAEPSLLWQEKFKTPVAMTSRLLNFEVIGDEKPEFPLRVIMTEENVVVLDGMGKAAKKVSLADYQQAVISDNGKMIAGMKDREISILTINNELQGTIKIIDSHPVILPEHISLELSPDGEALILISHISNSMYFYTKEGKELTKYFLDDLRGAQAVFSDNSEYAVVHVPNWGSGKTNGFLWMLNKKGEQQWAVDHKGCEAKFDISDSGDKVIMATEEILYSLDKKGNVLFEKELIPGNNDIALSGDGNYVLLTRSVDHTVSLLDNTKGESIWTYEIEGFDPLNSPITKIAASQDASHIIVCISKDWTETNKESYLYLLNKKGDVEWKKMFEEKGIECDLADDGSCMLVKGEKNMYLYRNPIDGK